MSAPLARQWVCELMRENEELRVDVKRLAQSEGDLLDEVHALRRELADRDVLIATLQEEVQKWSSRRWDPRPRTTEG
jgi:chromosome segregation ATPase